MPSAVAEKIKPTTFAISSTVHDVNSSISALREGIEVIKDEWRSNPELVNRLLPLMLDKINQVQAEIINYHHHSH